MTRLNIDDARCRALFASRLQQSDAPTAETVAEAIKATVRQFGIRGCAGVMAQEYGDHPEAAAERMRWVRQLVTGVPASPQTKGSAPAARWRDARWWCHACFRWLPGRSWRPAGHLSAARYSGIAVVATIPAGWARSPGP
jgi:hypothetical protein